MTSTRIIGHRGAPDVLPENTLEGFQHAIDSGADGLELDVFISRDGVPVVTHNPRLMAETTRGADGSWLAAEGPCVSELTFDELQSFDVGGIRPSTQYAQKHASQVPVPGARIPSLDAVLALVAAAPRELELLVELKHSPLATDGRCMQEIVALTAQALRARNVSEQSYLHAFNWQILAAAAETAPDLRRSHLSIRRDTHPDGTVYPGSPWLGGISHEPAAMLRQLAETGASVWSPFFQDLDSAALELAQDLGLQVMTWTIRGRQALAEEMRTGVDAIITDDAGMAVELRAGSGSGQQPHATREQPA